MLNRDEPGRIEFFKGMKLQSVACGGLHTIALTKDNKLYSWGSTEGGQLGLPISFITKICRNEENAVKTPQLLASLQDYYIT